MSETGALAADGLHLCGVMRLAAHDADELGEPGAPGRECSPCWRWRCRLRRSRPTVPVAAAPPMPASASRETVCGTGMGGSGVGDASEGVYARKAGQGAAALRRRLLLGHGGGGAAAAGAANCCWPARQGAGGNGLRGVVLAQPF